MKFIVPLILVFSLATAKAQQTEIVDFKTLKATISLLPKNESVKGELQYTFGIKKATDSIFLDGKNMQVKLLKDSPLKTTLRASAKKIWLVHPFKANKTYTVKFSYDTQPKQALYFVGWNTSGSNQIWSQGQGKETSHWLPSLDDKTDKIQFDITYTAPKGYTVVGNGKLIKHKTRADQGLWHYNMKQPMSSYLVAVAVGHYDKKTRSTAGGTPLELYYEPKDSLKVEPTYRYSKQMFDFFEKEIGVEYPWQNYKQIPVRDFLYAGMENTTATIFSESFMTDSIGFIDRNYVNVNAHELAHQWFGDLVTAESSKSHWLQEGFATYYALLAERAIFGDENYYYKLYENAEKLKAQSDDGKGEALTDPTASSLTFYQKGAWALHILREKVGDKAFRQGVKTYLETYKFQNATTTDFIDIMEKSSGKDLSEFVDNWLNQTAFQAEDALKSLRKSTFLQDYLKIAALRQTPLIDKIDRFSGALNFPVNQYIGQEVVHQLSAASHSKNRRELLKKAFATNIILVRQAIAISLKKIPEDLQLEYESLLNDDSYLTQEKALFNLWQNFPENRENYLDKLKDTQGFYDKNVRMMWLTLSLVTQSYHPEKNKTYYQELSGYSSPTYDYAIRQNAFGHLYQINTFSDQNYRDLLQASTHPVWRFRKFARELLEKLLEEDRHRSQLQILKPQLPENERKVLEKKMG